MKNLIKIFLLTLFIFAISSCEDKISVDLDQGESQLVVDAFLNNLKEKQTIRLTMSAPYFDNLNTYYATGAIVTLKDDAGKSCQFTEEGNGIYSYTPQAGDGFCQIGRGYELSVKYKGQEFYANSYVNPVPAIDSIRIRKEKNPFSKEEQNVAEFFATDIKGRRDFYWIRTIYNDTLKLIGNADNVSDGAFSGDGADGLPFITPMRDAINKQFKPYFQGDTITVRLLSVNEGTYDWINDVFTQTNNGGLFATPPANVRTNIKNRDTQSKTKAVGWFVTSAISTAGIRVK